MINAYVCLFGTKPKTLYHSPLEKGDHPEGDDSEFLLSDNIKKYQSLIGAMQWAISLGRLDITSAVMTLSSFRVAPHQGHMSHVQRIYGYLTQFKNAAIWI